MHTKEFNKFFYRWEQFRVGAIPRLPPRTYMTFLKYPCDLLNDVLLLLSTY